jgi:hypothetical protein
MAPVCAAHCVAKTCGGSCELRSGTRFEFLAFLLSSWADAKTEGARAKRTPCGDTLTS